MKRIDCKIKVRMVLNSSLKESFAETHVQGDRVAIVVWSDEPVLFLIEEKNVANSYLKFFENVWNGSIS